MKYMLDTNICIYVIKKKPDKVLKEFLKYKKGDLVISSLVLAELEHGVQKSQHYEKSRFALELFMAPLEIIPFDANAAKE
ncbi:MAG: type II toxin-antitoxin system VapC family toxin [Desulfobacterales bacterium]